MRLRRWQQWLVQCGLALVGLFVLVPLWAMVQMAFDGALKGWPLEFRAWPAQPTLAVFAQAWTSPAQSMSFLALLKNSLIVSGGAALLSVALGTTMAYAFARMRFPGQRPALSALLLGALLPPIALMTPLYILLPAEVHTGLLGMPVTFELRTGLLGLIVVYTAFAMPFCVWNMRAAFQAVPKELEESAFLDGAGTLGTFLHVSLPLALPSIGVAGVVAFLAGYSEFVMAWLFIDKVDKVTLAMAISGMVGQFGASWNLLAALALMMSVPVVVLFFILQRYLLKGLLFGAAD